MVSAEAGRPHTVVAVGWVGQALGCGEVARTPAVVIYSATQLLLDLRSSCTERKLQTFGMPCQG